MFLIFFADFSSSIVFTFFNSYIVKRLSRLACLCMRFFFFGLFFSWVYNLLVTRY